MYNIRDDVIPNGKIDELKKYLDNDIFLEDASMTQIIETLYGCAVSVINIQIISFENNIKINKLNIIKEIYYADCINEYTKRLELYDCRIEMSIFSGKIEEEYIDRYWNMFE
jgi:hypothetical protein